MKTLSEVKDILESDVSNEEKKNLLSQFNEDNAKLFSFVVGDDVETKQNTLRSFISFISSDIDKTGLFLYYFFDFFIYVQISLFRSS